MLPLLLVTRILSMVWESCLLLFSLKKQRSDEVYKSTGFKWLVFTFLCFNILCHILKDHFALSARITIVFTLCLCMCEGIRTGRVREKRVRKKKIHFAIFLDKHVKLLSTQLSVKS